MAKLNKLEIALYGVGILSIGYLLTHPDTINKLNDVISLLTPTATDTCTFATTRGDAKTIISSETIVPDTENYNTFISKKYGVQFDYPNTWQKNPRYEDKYEGTGGFFEVANFTDVAEGIDAAVEDQINAPYKPYGDNPKIEKLTLDGQPACIIYPSADQYSFFKDRDCVIVVQYPVPNNTNGHLYNFVDIWTTPKYIPLITKTFKFVPDYNIN